LTLALRILLSMPLWLLRLIVLLLLAVPGLALILWQAHRVEVGASRRFPGRTVLRFLARWMAPYQNDEDGIDGLRGGDPAQQWWADKTAGWSPQKRIFVWSALRNPVDSLRWMPLLNPKLEPARVRYVGMGHEPGKGEDGWYFAWLAGTAYSCIRVERWGFRAWLGWKLKPEDARGLHPDDPRAIRCDFACQLKRVAHA
jgi:hypothetical protein